MYEKTATRKILSLFVILCLALSVIFVSSPTVTYAASAYYVDTVNGRDNDPSYDGLSLAKPFKTIQKAASVMQAGDTCYVRAGTYNETVTPSNSGTAGSPITFMPYNGESVTISGADTISSSAWSLDSGNIYKATVSVGSGLLANQIFVDSQMMTEARWPNTGLDLLNRTDATAGTGTTATTVYDTNLNSFPSGYWNGGKIWIVSGDAWWAQTGSITSSGSGYVTFGSLLATGSWYDPKAGNKYYLYGKKAALDTANEWFYDTATSTLYFWAPSGVNPNTLNVKMKQRNYAFNISSKSYITIKGFNIFSCTIKAANSNNIIVDGIDAKYISHYTEIGDDGLNGQASHYLDAGLIFDNASDCMVRNSKIAYSAGSGIVFVGGGMQIVNNQIHDTDYSACAHPAIRCGFDQNDPEHENLVRGNTLYNTGRDGITSYYLTHLVYNDIYNFGILTKDNGGVYNGGAITFAKEKTVIAYNKVHDNLSAHFPDGIYLDTGARPYLVHHNLVYNIPATGIRLNGWTPHDNNRDNYIYNNTVVCSGNAIDTFSAYDMNGTRIINNIFRRPYATSPGAYLANNLPYTTDPSFTNAATYNFTLQSTSPAKDAGQVIPGITDGYSGTAPDMGAFEYGLTAWTAGYNAPAAGAPGSPTANAATNKTASSMNVSWGAVSGATGYKVKYGTSSGIYSSTVDVGNVTSYTISSLKPDTVYYYAVTAYNASGESTQSYQLKARTTEGTTGHYKFEDNANDSSPSGNNATNYNGTYVTGKNALLGKALSLNGTTAYAQIAHNSSLEFGAPSNAFTVAAWIKTSQAGKTFVVKGRHGQYSNTDYQLYTFTDGRLIFARWNNTMARNEFIYDNNGQLLNDNAWHHVVFVNESASSHKLYVDGVLVETSTTTWVDTSSNTENVYIGRYKNYIYEDSYLNGLVDDVRIYQRALNAAEVGKLADPSLVGWWQFEDNANDSSIYANNGTNNGATYVTGRNTRLGKALSFNGTSNYVEIPHNPSLDWGEASKPFTIAAWIKTTVAGKTIVSKGRPTQNANNDYQLYLYTDGRPLALHWSMTYIRNEFVYDGDCTPMNDGSWHHLAFVNEGASSHKIYIDGVLSQTDTTTWVDDDRSIEPVHIGRYKNHTYSDDFWNGQIDDVRLYTRALEANEIAELAR